MALLGLTLAAGRHAPEPAGASWGPLDSYHQLGGATTGLALWEDRLHAVIGSRLWTFNLAASEPRALGVPIVLPDLAEDLAVFEGWLYLPTRATGGQGEASLQVYDLRAPEGPRSVGPPLPLGVSEVGAIVVRYPDAFLLSEQGLLQLDLKEPDRPRLHRRIEMRPPARAEGEALWRGAIALANRKLWVAREWGLFEIDLGPRRPVARPLDGRPALALSQDRGRLAVAREGGRVEVHVTASHWSAVTPWATGLASIQALGWSAAGGELWVLGDEGRTILQLAVDDAGRVTSERRREVLSPVASPRARMALRNGRPLVALERAGLLEIGDCERCGRWIGPWLPPVEQWSLQGGRLLAAAGDAGIFLLDLATPAGAKVLGDWRLIDQGEGDIRLWPERAGPAGSSGAAALRLRSVVFDEREAYVLTEASGLFTLAMRDGVPDSVVGRLSELPTAAQHSDMLLTEQRLFLAAGDGSLRVFDRLPEATPRQQAEIPQLGAQSLAWHDGELLVGGEGAFGGGRLTRFDPHTLEPRGRVELERFHERIFVSGGFAYLSGSSGFVEVVDLRDPERLTSLPRLTLRGMPAGRLAEQGALVLAAQPGRIDLLRRLDSGALLPMARELLPVAGIAWQGATDASVAAGQVLLGRGRSGLMVTAGTDEKSAAEPDDVRSPRGPEQSFLPWLGARSVLQEPRNPQAKASTPACAEPSRLVIAVEDGALVDASDLAMLATLIEALPTHLHSISLGWFGSQAELLSAGPPRELAERLRAGELAIGTAPPDGPTSKPSEHRSTGGRLDLALVMAEKQLRVIPYGIGTGSDVSPAVLLLTAGLADEHATRLAGQRARAMREAGWRIGIVVVGHASAAADATAELGSWAIDGWPELDLATLATRLHACK